MYASKKKKPIFHAKNEILVGPQQGVPSRWKLLPLVQTKIYIKIKIVNRFCTQIAANKLPQMREKKQICSTANLPTFAILIR